MGWPKSLVPLQNILLPDNFTYPISVASDEQFDISTLCAYADFRQVRVEYLKKIKISELLYYGTNMKKWIHVYTINPTFRPVVLEITFGISICLPHQVKRSICISDFMQTTFFYFERFLKKLADDQNSSITKGSIYHIKHYVCTTFYHSSGLTRN